MPDSLPGALQGLLQRSLLTRTLRGKQCNKHDETERVSKLFKL